MGKNISKIYRKTKNWIPHATRHFLGSSRSLFALKQNKKIRRKARASVPRACPCAKNGYASRGLSMCGPRPTFSALFPKKTPFFQIFFGKNTALHKRGNACDHETFCETTPRPPGSRVWLRRQAKTAATGQSCLASKNIAFSENSETRKKIRPPDTKADCGYFAA